MNEHDKDRLIEAMKTVADAGGYLPILPTFYDKPSEERIERTVSRLFDRADSALMNGRVTQAQYDAWSDALGAWADHYYDCSWPA